MPSPATSFVLHMGEDDVLATCTRTGRTPEALARGLYKHRSRPTGEVANEVAGEGIFFPDFADATIRSPRLPTDLPARRAFVNVGD